MHIQFKRNGVIKEVKAGFSWTTLFFPGFTQFFRGEFILGIIILILNIALMCIPGIIWAFMCNKYTARRLASDGWEVLNKENPVVQQQLLNWNIAQEETKELILG